MSEEIEVFDFIVSIISKSGYFGVFVLMFLENVFPPIPSELIMPMGGYLAEQGELSFAGLVVVGTLGSLLSQLVFYYWGQRIGEERLKSWADKHGHWVAISSDEIERSKNWFRRWGGAAVFLGRLVPTVRSLISIPAGLVGMPLPKFVGYTLAGTTIWTAALTGAGLLLGKNYEKISQYLDPVSYAIVIFLVGGYLWRVIRSYRKPAEAGS